MIPQRGPMYVAGLLAALFSAATGAADPPSLELKQTIALKGKAGNLDHMALDAKRDRLLVANKSNNTLDIVDLKSGKLLKQVRNQGGIQGIAYAADLDRVFVGLGAGGFCNAFDGQEFKLLKTVKFADDADNVRYNPRTHVVYVAHVEKALGVIDARTYQLKADIKLPGQAESFQLEKERPRLYVNVPSSGEVAVIDTEKNEVIQRYPLKLAGNNYPMALDEAGRRLFIGCRKKPMVVVLGSDTGKEIAGLDIPADIDDLFFDGQRKRLYASCGEGFIAVLSHIDADHYEAIDKIPTVKGARTSLFDPQQGRYFLAVPRQPGKEGPEMWVYQVPR